MSPPHAAALDELRRADARIEAASTTPWSLCPGRPRATPLETLGRELLTPTVDPSHAAAFATALARLAEAQLGAFPDNLFWDFDFVAARLVAAPPADLARTADLAVALYERFGSRPIAFRYAHDFVYGFDWAKWVRKQPADRGSVGPFDLAFLQALFDRGGEILDLIADDDATYGRIADDVPRNPFPFSREPEHEARLHRDLAERGLVPVETWRQDARPTWDRPFAELRIERARALAIPPA